jgi:tetratricopeptide (TPR) repeat protein
VILKEKISKYILLCLFLFGMSWFFQGCSNKKNTFANRSYHNVLARYNGYFYACENIKEAVVKLETAHKDDYTRILAIYKLGDEKDAKSIYPLMDTAFKKSSLVISRHSIKIRDTEYVKWIDDNYLALGLTHFYKRDYFAAAEIFDYIIKQYKKEEIRYDAIMWLIRTYNENAIVSQAQLLIDLVDNDKKFPKRIRGDLDMAIADFYLKREDYPMAAKYLEKALVNVKKKKIKTRLNYILAQLYQKTGDDRKALARFTEVLKLSPDYEMAFQAKINQAKSFSGDSKGKKGIKAQLVKMSKEIKNEEYFDQIFYALAEIALKEKEEYNAIKYLNKSIALSLNNLQQKALSYLLLGDISFKKPDYKYAQAYYDSCATILPATYVHYAEIIEKKEILTNLISNLTVISREDSLQRIALMNESDRDKFLDNMIEEFVKKEEKRIKEEKEKQERAASQSSGGPVGTANSNEGGNSGGSGHDWYFYNKTMVAMGFNEFRKKWSDRKLEDNWRRSTKEAVMFTYEENEGGETPLNPTSVEGQEIIFEAIRDKKQYLKNLPLTREKMLESTDLIIEAYYNAGAIYKEQLSDNKNAIKTFEEFVQRYPNGKYNAKSYYQLYRCNIALPNEPRADYYKNILFTRFPESEYTKIIKNPLSAKTTTAAKNEIEAFYEETYRKYLLGEYGGVMLNCITAEEEYANSIHSPKFEFLKALVIGRTQGIIAFEDALKQIIALHPTDPVKQKAEELLEYIENQKPAQAKEQDVKSKYALNKDEQHNCILIVNQSVDITALKVSLSNFNLTYFSTETLMITNLPLTQDKQMIVITGLANQAKSITYYNAIKSDADVFSKTGTNPKTFAISAENYPIFYKEKNIEEYEQFFNTIFLKK